MILTVAKESQDANLAMHFVLPHGLHLPSGLPYQVDAGEENKVDLIISNTSWRLLCY